MTTIKCSLGLFPGEEPLRKRAPAVDENGRPLSDFMVLFPGLREKPRPHIQRTLSEIHAVLAAFGPDVVFAEVNLRLNLLWVSIRPIHGISNEICGALQHRIPYAKRISHL